MRISGFSNRRAWLLATLVSFSAISCASIPEGVGGPVSEEAPELRVDVQWRLPVHTDELWQFDRRELGEPVLSPGGDLLLGAGNGNVYRIMSHSGEIAWSSQIGGKIDAAAALANQIVYVGNDAGHLVALSWRTGEELWRFQARGSLESRPTVAEGRVFFTDSNEVLYALNATTGELVWDYQRSAPEFFTIKGGGEALVVGNRLFVGFADGVLTALDVVAGDEIWAVHLGADTGEFGDIDLPLRFDGERIYAVSHAGGVYAVEPATGALLWRQPYENVVGLIEESGWLFGASATGRVFGLNGRTGAVAWEHRLSEEDLIPMGLSSTGRFLAVPTARGPMVWLRANNGEPVISWAPSSGFQRAPVFDESQGYVISNQGYLYGFQLAR